MIVWAIKRADGKYWRDAEAEYDFKSIWVDRSNDATTCPDLTKSGEKVAAEAWLKAILNLYRLKNCEPVKIEINEVSDEYK